jgi:hypothetical protein
MPSDDADVGAGALIVIVPSCEEAAVSLTNVWLQTRGDGLVRADQVAGIEAHQTPELTGKPSYWLLDIVLPSQVGSGSGGELWINVLHRTLIQTSQDPGDAPVALARLLAQLDTISAAGIVVTTRHGADNGAPATDGIAVGSATVRFQFIPFTSPPPRDDTGAEYL